MKVTAVYRVERQGYNIYVELEPGSGSSSRYYRAKSATGQETVEEVEPGQEVPVYLFVDERIAQALGEALAPRPEATERHLDDALAVRDRAFRLLDTEQSRSHYLLDKLIDRGYPGLKGATDGISGE